ncbi:winged helix-turn-helix transcriptional regulator [Actinoplanes bogorensis]|uniref:Winged helix-turn-helix transcriptional regulator n=1 Tax=Paractinoplanes bogorensis TaxID=1610840 RepID=A0ABS5YV00_9ACTN|nr:winged helix-turn-helix transcriptional regulator [Actinoplanes bogorensis]MBU2667270.1 winged helix-turn-helix transcriptional regulator [Actinoplanes bogorensis]
MSGSREKRSYEQQCGLAIALDVIGERWTLLVVRELLVRPRRYRELLDALPGIGTNLLAERLRGLEEAGLVTRLDPDRRTAGYALTERGAALRGAVVSMARFGLDLAGQQPGPSHPVARASWAVLAIEAMTIGARTEGIDETYEFTVDDEVFSVVVAGDSVRVQPGAASDPVLTVRTDAATFMDIGTGHLDPVEALLGGRVTTTGPVAAVTRCLRTLGLTAARPDGRSAPARAVAPEYQGVGPDRRS